MDDAWYRGPVLGANDEHVAAIAVRDDLVLEVLGRVAPAKERFQRRPQARALLAQAVADAGKRRTCLVGDLA